MALEFHPISEIFPLMEGKPFASHLRDIQRQGLLEPIVLYEGKILDGRNRYRACLEAGVEPTYVEFSGTPEEAIERVWSLNFERRQLTSSQAACADAVRNKMLDSYRAVREAAKARQVATQLAGKDGSGKPVTKVFGGGTNTPTEEDEEGKEVAPKGKASMKTRDLRAKAAGTSPRYIDMADKLLEEDPEEFAKVQKGEKNLSEVREERQLVEIRRGKKSKAKKKPVRKKPPTVIIGEKVNRRVVEGVIKCAQKGVPLSYQDIRRANGYPLSYMDEFLTNCQLIPWVHVRVSLPEGNRRRPRASKHEKNFLYQFFIDQDLKNICDDWQTQPRTGYKSVLTLVTELNDEIRRRREEMQGRTRRTNWNPDSIARVELVRVLDYIQEQLDLIIDPAIVVSA